MFSRQKLPESVESAGFMSKTDRTFYSKVTMDCKNALDRRADLYYNIGRL